MSQLEDDILEIPFDDAFSGWAPNELRQIQDERDRLLGTVLKAMRLHLLWPSREEERDVNRLYIKKPLLFYSILIPGLFFLFYHVFYVLFVKKDLMKFLEDLTIVGTGVCLLGIIYVYILKLQKFVSLSQNSFEYTLKFETPQEVYDFAKRFNKLFAITYVAITLLIITVLVWKFVTSYGCEKEDDYEFCGVVLKIRAPFIVDFTPFREFALFLMICGALMILHGSLILVACISLVMRLLIFRMDHLQTEILSDHSDLSEIDLRAKLRCHCVYYGTLLVIKDGINDVFYSISFILFSISATNVALLEFQVILAKSIVCLIYFVGWIAALAIIHLTGQTLIDKNEDMCNAVYSMKWFEFPVKTRIYVLMLLTRAQKSFEIINGPLSNLSAIAFLSVLKASYSYMTYLLNFIE